MNIRYSYPYYPYLKLRFTARNQPRVYDIDAYIDTGFYEDERRLLPGSEASIPQKRVRLIVPLRFRDELGKPDFSEAISLANGREYEIPAYYGGIKVNGETKPRPAVILCLGNGCLIGRHLIDEFKVFFDKGKVLTIEDC